MGAVEQAIYDRQVNDPTVAGLVSSYHGSPACFTNEVPEDAEAPYTVMPGDVAANPWDTKTTRGREIVKDIRCVWPRDANNTSSVPVETLAERIYQLFHRHSLVVSGFQTVVAAASPPLAADEPDAFVRVVSLRLILFET